MDKELARILYRHWDNQAREYERRMHTAETFGQRLAWYRAFKQACHKTDSYYYYAFYR